MLAPGSEFAGYTIVSALGVGGMGQVYLADHPCQHVRVALKIVADDARRNDEDFDDRFLSVTSAVAALRHPGIIAIHDYGIDGITPWCTMDFIDGVSLDQETPTLNEIAVISSRIAEGLDHAHRHRIVHRDIKPANIMVTRDGKLGAIDRVVILDFGTAKIISPTNPMASAAAFIGTMAYTAPEIIRGHTATGRADQYSLAATIYRLITGHTPFAGKSMLALAVAAVKQEAPPISSEVPALSALDPVFATALAKEPAQRYPSCQSFARALTKALHSRPHAPPWSPVVPSMERHTVRRIVPPARRNGVQGRESRTRIVDAQGDTEPSQGSRRTPGVLLATSPADLSPAVYARRRTTAVVCVLAILTLIVAALVAAGTGDERAPTEYPARATPASSDAGVPDTGVPDPRRTEHDGSFQAPLPAVITTMPK